MCIRDRYLGGQNLSTVSQKEYHGVIKRFGNHGDIKVTRSYIKNGFKCADYTSTVNIKDQFPIYSMSGIDRSTEFGTACMLPDGRWKVIERVL